MWGQSFRVVGCRVGAHGQGLSLRLKDLVGLATRVKTKKKKGEGGASDDSSGLRLASSSLLSLQVLEGP